MRIFKIKAFHKWAKKMGISDSALSKAIIEIETGMVEVNLGGNIYKKRVPLPGKGKSGSTRIILAYKKNNRAFFIYGFEKNAQANISDTELKALKIFGKKLLGFSEAEVNKNIENGALTEITGERQ